MNPPTSTVPEIQARIDKVTEVFNAQTEEDIFWLRWQGAITEANRQRLNSINYGVKENKSTKT